MFRQAEEMLPLWLQEKMELTADSFDSLESRMQFVIELSRLNIEKGTGGPFAAAVFDADKGTLIAVGVNRVVPLNSSSAHAEMLAMAGAQQKFGSFDLGAAGLPSCELVTSCEPCAMCFGAIPWSGVRRLVCGATALDAQRIGFDEGPRHPDWVAELERRGIGVMLGVERAEAAAVLNAYLKNGGLIYNGRADG